MARTLHLGIIAPLTLLWLAQMFPLSSLNTMAGMAQGTATLLQQNARRHAMLFHTF